MSKQEGQLLQKDHASAFVVKIFFTSTLITMQNLVVVSHTVCVHVGGLTNLEDAEGRDRGDADPLETHYSHIPNFITISQTI